MWIWKLIANSAEGCKLKVQGRIYDYVKPPDMDKNWTKARKKFKHLNWRMVVRFVVIKIRRIFKSFALSRAEVRVPRWVADFLNENIFLCGANSAKWHDPLPGRATLHASGGRQAVGQIVRGWSRRHLEVFLRNSLGVTIANDQVSLGRFLFLYLRKKFYVIFLERLKRQC